MKLSRIVGPVAIIAVNVLIAEVLLRVIPSPIQYPSLYEFDDPQSLVGIELVPNTKSVTRRTCLTADVSTNSAGWRDVEHSAHRAPDVTRIVVLGDSYMEGIQVNDDQIFARQLEKEMPGVEVLNFGLATIGTVQQDILYEKIASTYKPDIVLVAFYSNDIANNDRLLEAGTGGTTRLTYRAPDGSLAHTRTGGIEFQARKWLRIHSAVFRLVKAVARVFSDWGTQVASGPASFPRQYNVYRPVTDGDWARAWTETEAALARLKARMEPNQTLVVFNVPDIYQVAPDPAALLRKEFSGEPPADFDPSLPNRTLEAIASRLDIGYIDMNAAFRAYRDAHHLKEPYFFFPCEGHWNSLGHALAAQTVANVLSAPLP